MKTFTCKITNSWVRYELDGDMADMRTFYFEHKHIKPFFALISESIEELKTEHKIKKIRQMVTIDDYENLLKGKTKWDVIQQDPILQACLLECDIDNFIDNFAKGHGIK